MERVQYVYGLVHPDTGIVHYIGLSTHPNSRAEDHAKADTNIGKWIRSLSSTPLVLYLDTVQSHEDARAVEKFHIISHKKAGFPLLNKCWVLPQEKGHGGKAMRPKLKLTKVLIGMSQSQAEWLRGSAYNRDLTISEFVRRIIDDEIEKEREFDRQLQDEIH